jgi:uncharacterized membrane protein YqhA
MLHKIQTYIPFRSIFFVKFISTIAISSDNSLTREITFLIYSIFDYLEKKIIRIIILVVSINFLSNLGRAVLTLAFV